MKKLLILTLMLTTTGCATIMEGAAQYLAEMQDTARYEEIRDSVSSLCDTKNYDMFVDRYGKGVIDKLMIDVCSPVTRKTDPGL